MNVECAADVRVGVVPDPARDAGTEFDPRKCTKDMHARIRTAATKL